MRRTFSVNVNGLRVVGTLHEPVAAVNARTLDVGFLFLNFGQAPRSGLADVAAFCADALAANGVLTFRVDMPGIGDTDGSLPVYLQQLWREIEDGAHTPYAIDVVRTLLARHGLKGFVLCGLCGGAVTAVYAAGALRDETVGLVLIEPDFALHTPPNAEGLIIDTHGDEDMDTRTYFDTIAVLLQNLRSPESWRRLFSGQASYRKHVHLIQHGLNRVRDRVLGKKLPPDANLPLIDCLRRLGARGMATLVLTAGDAHLAFIQDDVLAGVGKKQMRFEAIENTNHMFATQAGKDAAAGRISRWLRAHFA